MCNVHYGDRFFQEPAGHVITAHHSYEFSQRIGRVSGVAAHPNKDTIKQTKTCSVLQDVALFLLAGVSHKLGWQRSGTVFGVLRDSSGVLQCVAVCCSVLQCVAVCCSVLQCVSVCCSVSQVIHRVLATRLVQGLDWVFASKKERKKACVCVILNISDTRKKKSVCCGVCLGIHCETLRVFGRT